MAIVHYNNAATPPYHCGVAPTWHLPDKSPWAVLDPIHRVDKGVGLGLRQTWTKIPACLLLIDGLDFGVNVMPAPYILMSVRASFSLLARVPVTLG